MKYRTLSRTSSHRQALLRNLVTSLFKHESISTTWHKAKEAQRLAEKLVTLGKKNTAASKRRATEIFFVCLPPNRRILPQKTTGTPSGRFEGGNQRRQRTKLTDIQEPHELVPKLFSTIRKRYRDRPGGYTRVLRIEPIKEDQAASAILELVDGPKDMRFAMTAKTVARLREEGKDLNEMTQGNITKVTRYMKNGENKLESMIKKFRGLMQDGDEGVTTVKQKKVYNKDAESR